MKPLSSLRLSFSKFLDFLTPKLSDPDLVRRGYILNLIIVTYGLLYSLSAPIVISEATKRLDVAPFWIGLALLGLYSLFGSTLYLSFRGRVKLAAHLLILMLLVSNAFTYLNLTLSPDVLIGAHAAAYYILVVVAALTVGPWSSILTALVSFAALFLPVLFNASFKQFTPAEQDAAISSLRLHGTFMLGMTLLIVISFHAIKRTVIATLYRQNAELKVANAALSLRQSKDAELNENLVGLAQQLTYISTVQTNRIGEQAHFVSDISVTLTELSQTAQQMSRVAQMVQEAAQNTLLVARHNGEAVTQSAHDFDELKKDMGSLAAIASQLYNQSEKVSEVMDFLNEVADETHLLGINATIEASEAGMLGRRFGVVAAEVQNLAERSRRSTQQVKLAVGQVKAGIESCFQLTSQGLDKAIHTATIAQAAGQAIDQIVANADNSSVLAQTIASVSQQQQGATNFVAEMIRELEITSRETVKQTEQITATASALLNTASRLKQMHQPNAPQGAIFLAEPGQLPPPDQHLLTKTPPELLQV